jgi:hypothetical protein
MTGLYLLVRRLEKLIGADRVTDGTLATAFFTFREAVGLKQVASAYVDASVVQGIEGFGHVFDDVANDGLIPGAGEVQRLIIHDERIARNMFPNRGDKF